jgi:hypothetical protein
LDLLIFSIEPISTASPVCRSLALRVSPRVSTTTSAGSSQSPSGAL